MQGEHEPIGTINQIRALLLEPENAVRQRLRFVR
jgi:hypothetical protein